MHNIITDQIDHLNFDDGEIIRSTHTVHATRSTVA
jgi:hypothetical protein